MRGVIGALGLVAIAALSLWWLQHPPRGEQAYRERSVQTAHALRSHVATARLWAGGVGDGSVTEGAASIALEEASSGADSTSSTFAAWVPPRRLEGLRRAIAEVADATTDALGAVHIASQRGRWRVVAGEQRRLRELERRLTRVASGARS